MAKKNVLVFPCGTEVGLEIHRSLACSTHFNLVGGSSAEDHGAYVYDRYVGDIPYVGQPRFMERISQVVDEHDIDFIFPAHDSATLELARAVAEEHLLCGIVTSPLRTCEISRSKRATYDALAGIVHTPRILETVCESDLPIFLKPDVGQGSKGTQAARTLEDVAFYRARDESLLALEYLPGAEFTVDCFTDRHGCLRYCEGRERRRISGGISVNSVRVVDSRFRTMAEAINSTLQFRGVWFFQVKQNSLGELVLMEIAARVAGAMGLSRARGVNLPLLSLFDMMDQEVEIRPNSYEVVMDRALHARYRHNIQYSVVYLDFDDVVLCEGHVAPVVMAFIFQCFNRNVPVRLITRHKLALADTLKRNRLEGLFQDVIWLQNGEGKHLHIKERDAIFIDDSFVERREVQRKCNIPVFDGHMIECLLDGRLEELN